MDPTSEESDMNEADSQLRAAVAAAPMILFVLDSNGIFTVCEGKALGLLGLAPRDVVGRSVFDVGALHAIEAYRRALGGETFVTKLDIDGMVFETRFTPMHDADDVLIGVVGVAANVTENARLVDALGQANRFKSDMVAIIAHELRTPLNAIMGYTDLLIEEEFGPLGSGQLTILRRVDRSAQVLRDLVAGTLELSRLDSGQLPLNLRNCDVNDLIREVEVETREQRRKPGVTFRWQTPQLPSMYSDALKIKVILKNLIANAVKFTQQGEVIVSAAARRDGILLSVADTGIGIGAEVLPHIFDPFRQGEPNGSYRFGGVGLGLYLVRRLVDVLAGTVEVESTRGRGSLFRVWLPLTHPRQASDDLRTPPEQRSLREHAA
jgi:signal transduction histidine kinase